jgi:hypothetical protein
LTFFRLREDPNPSINSFSTFDWWEVELQFRATGRGRVGADGLAFWFSSTKGFGGPVFGSADKWNGLGLFFDSYDNDNKHNNPYIMGMVNDGTKAYDHQVRVLTTPSADPTLAPYWPVLPLT